MAPRLIGLTGKAGSGKDTVGQYLHKWADAYTLAFAYPLKAGLAAMGFPEPKDREAKEAVIAGFNFSWRELAQTLGTEWGRARDPDLWLKLAMQEVDRIRAARPHSLVVITDVRFENEAAAIRERGGQIWHITGREAQMFGDTKTHASETGVQVANGDKVIVNSGTLVELADLVDELMGASRG